MSARLGIIGAGQIARFHAEAIRACGGCLAVVADVDEVAGRRFAAAAGAAHASTTAVLADAGIDAVIVATPNATHVELALDALAAGKDVLCEKPMTTNVDDSWRLVEAVRARPGVVFQVGYMKRFNPGFRLLADVLPRIGEPIHATFRVLAERKPVPADTWYRRPQESGGGILTHSGSHLIDIMRFLLGEPVRVDARIRFVPDRSGLDQSTLALIDLADGLAVELSAVSTPAPLLGHTGEGWEETVEVIGTEGRVRLSSPNWQGTAPCLLTLQLAGERGAQTLLPEAGSQWEAEMRDFLDAVATRRPATPGAIDGYRVDAVLAALYASGRERSPVEVATRC